MCGRFVQRYNLGRHSRLVRPPGRPCSQFAGPLQRCAHRSRQCREADYRRRYRTRFHSLGPHTVVVQQASEASAGKLQRASGDCRRQAHVSGCVRATSVHYPGPGYYEWLKKPDGRQPYFISAADGGALCRPVGSMEILRTANLWFSCTIIVTDANELTGPIHDRMPVVLGLRSVFDQRQHHARPGAP
jgi:hypothetical protein